MTGPLMIPRDNYSCDIVRGVPGLSGVIIILSASFSCLRRTVGGAGPSGQARGVRVQRPASEHWPVEHLHGEVSRAETDTYISEHLAMFQLPIDQDQACGERQQARQRGHRGGSAEGGQDTADQGAWRGPGAQHW